MDLNELEFRKLPPDELKPKEELTVEESNGEDGMESEDRAPKSSKISYKTLFKLSIVLALLVGLLVGLIGGIYLGRFVYKCPTDGNGGTTADDSIFSQFDYSSMIIDVEKNITIENFYDDNEERYYAMQWIGMELPELEYVNSKGETVKLADLGQGKYIIEFMEPTCTFCNGMIDMVDQYRETEGAVPVIGLSIKDGDLSNFNKNNENTFTLVNKTVTTKQLVSMIVWVPMFVFVEDGRVKLVSFGNMEGVETMQEYVDLAFK